MMCTLQAYMHTTLTKSFGAVCSQRGTNHCCAEDRKSNEWTEGVLQQMLKFESTTKRGSHMSTLFKVQTSLASVCVCCVCALYAFVVVTTAPAPPSSDSSTLLSQLPSWILTHICFTFLILLTAPLLVLEFCAKIKPVTVSGLPLFFFPLVWTGEFMVQHGTRFSRTCLFFWSNIIAVGVFLSIGQCFSVRVFCVSVVLCWCFVV